MSAIANTLKQTDAQAKAELPTPTDAERDLKDAGITFVEAGDFVKAELPQPDWIVPNLIAVSMRGDLCGGSKSRKTFLARQLAMCIASGTDFVGAYSIPTPSKVAYFDLELFDWNSQERMKAQSKALGILWDTFKGNLLISHLRGKAAMLRDDRILKSMISYLKANGVKMVILDPRYKLLNPGEDENTAEGLRGLLDFCQTLSAHFATLVVTHDPKGDTSQRKATDRGAGSYTGGADFDFRLTIDKAQDWSDETQAYVIESVTRARKSPAPFGVTFDDAAQIFRRDDTVQPVKQDERKGKSGSPKQRAAMEAAKQEAFRNAALQVVEGAGPNLLSCERFDAEVAKIPGATVAINQRRPMRKLLVANHTLATCPKKTIIDGKARNLKNGGWLISTPELIAAYLAQFEA